MLLTFLNQDAATWTAWGTWVYALLTLALVGVAFFQLKGLTRQVKDSQEAAESQLKAIERQIASDSQAAADQLAEMERARKAAARPLVYLSFARLIVLEGGDVCPILELYNAGPGAACLVEVRCWLDTATDSAGIIDAAREAADQIGRLQDRNPDGTATTVAPLAQGHLIETILVDGSGELVRLARREPYWAYVQISYEDIHGTVYHFPEPDPQAALPRLPYGLRARITAAPPAGSPRNGPPQHD